MHARHWLAVGLLGIGVSSIGVYFLMPWLQESLRQIAVWLGAGGIIGGLAFLFNFFRYLSENQEKKEQRLRQHTKILNDEIYKRLLHIFVEPTGNYCRKIVRKVPVNEKAFQEYERQRMLDPFEIHGKHEKLLLISLSRIDRLDWGISHLKDHQDVYNPWKKVENLERDYNDSVDSLDNELIRTIREKMEDSFPTFTDQYPNRRKELVPNTYDSDQINRFISEYVLSSLANNRQPNFENSLKQRQEKQSHSSSSSHWIVTPIEWTYMYLIDSVTEIELKKLEATLRAIVDEGEIMKKSQRLIDLSKEIKESIQAFEKAIRQLVKDIDNPLDEYLIKGTCKGCEKWNK